MRLVITTPFLETRGGMERVILQIAQRFNARVHCLRYDEKNTFQEFSKLDVEVAKPSLLRKLPLGKRVSGAIEAGNHFYNTELEDYDLINAHQTPSEWIRNKNSPVIWYCLHEDTPTIKKTADGYSYCQMKDVKPGDVLFSFSRERKSVLTKVRKVIRKRSSNLKILRLANGREITATGDHRFFVYEKGRFEEKRLSDVSEGDLIPLPACMKTTSVKTPSVDVEKILKKEFENHPYWGKRLFFDFKRENIAIGNRKTVLIPAKIKVSAELMRLLGYYLSEGYINFRHSEKREDMQLGFAFGIHEKNTLVKDCAHCASKIFGIEPKIMEVPNRSEIIVKLPNACEMFILALGCGFKARDKRVPNLIFNCASSLQKKFLEAYLAGDGHYEKKTKRWVCTSVGRHLVTGLLYLLSMLGKPATIVRRRAHKFNNYNERQKHQIYSLRFTEKGYVRYKRLNDIFLVPVKEIIDLKEEASVVDIEVGANHSFLAGDAIYTHNCHTPNREAFDLYNWRMKRRSIPSKAVFWSSIQAFKLFEFRTVPKLEYIFTNSLNSQRRIKRYLHRSSEVLHPGVDTEKFSCKGYENFFFYPSRIAPEKEIEYAIEAFKIFKKRADGWKPGTGNWKLVIAGALSKRPEHVRYFKKLQSMCDGSVTIETNVGDWHLRDLYARCRAVLYTPVNEDYGLVPLEAMASSKPCVARNEGGPRETISDGRDGYLIDSIWDMAGRMEKLAKDEQLCASMGKSGRRKVQRDFTWDRFLKRFGDKAKEVVSAKPR